MISVILFSRSEKYAEESVQPNGEQHIDQIKLGANTLTANSPGSLVSLVLPIPHKGAIHPWASRGVGLPTDAQE